MCSLYCIIDSFKFVLLNSIDMNFKLLLQYLCRFHLIHCNIILLYQVLGHYSLMFLKD